MKFVFVPDVQPFKVISLHLECFHCCSVFVQFVAGACARHPTRDINFHSPEEKWFLWSWQLIFNHPLLEGAALQQAAFKHLGVNATEIHLDDTAVIRLWSGTPHQVVSQ